MQHAGGGTRIEREHLQAELFAGIVSGRGGRFGRGRLLLLGLLAADDGHACEEEQGWVTVRADFNGYSEEQVDLVSEEVRKAVRAAPPWE